MFEFDSHDVTIKVYGIQVIVRKKYVRLQITCGHRRHHITYLRSKYRKLLGGK